MTHRNPLLEIEDLRVYFHLDAGVVRAVDGVSFGIAKGETLGVIGESGCGKSVTAQSILGIVPSPPGKTESGTIRYFGLSRNGGDPVELTRIDPKGEEIRHIRGNEISMIFQEPMTSFGPLNTIGDQIEETIMVHEDVEKEEARARTIELLRHVGIPKPEQNVDAYPHQFSGGMRQRVMIAMALSCSPKLLIADEPTTAVDVTIEAQIIDLLRELQQERGLSIMLITHNLALVSELAERIVVMYLGKCVEQASTEEIFTNPRHPYTRALWRSIPKLEGKLERLDSIKGVIPSPYMKPKGCPFHPRCDSFIMGKCDGPEFPESVEVVPGHTVHCYLYD